MSKINEVKFTVITNRVEIYRDFSINLLYYIHDFYLDPDTLSSNDDIYNHFSFCYNKVCDEFLLEDINFKDNKELNEYFHKYYYHQFYKSSETIDLKNYEKFWNTIFDIDKQKNKNLINILVELYHVFDKSLEKKENILDVVEKNT